MSLDFVRTSPLENAKWASAPWPVDVPYVPVELLDPFEASILALYTRVVLHTRVASRASTFAAAAGSFDKFMPSCYARLRLGHVSMHSHHGTRRRVLASKEGTGTLDCGPNMKMGNASVIA